jgi:Ca-activated chloride channel family protein
MMCDQSELRMAELLLGEIAPADRAALERHLLDCETCRDDYELARAGFRSQCPDQPVPQALVESTLASIQQAPRVVRLFRWATAAAALFGVAVVLVASGRSPAPVPLSEPVAPTARTTERPTVLATMQEPLLGALTCKDDAGRPVGDLGLKTHEVSVEILDGIAKTTVEENFENHTDRRLEGTFTFPLPSDASISRLALEVNGKIEEGTCLERERARQVFESIVRRMQDPALLEWQPGGLFKCRVFPIEPRATKRVIVAYTQTLPCFQGKMRYVYPLASEKTRTHPPGEVRINVLARFSGALAKLESTSHHLDVQRKDTHEASMTFRATNYRPNNDFVVALEPAEEEVRVVCYKPDGEDGYFACFATPQATETRVPQKYTFVVDASASISAPRLEVAKRLVRAMMERKIAGDRFEVIAHSIETQSSGEVDLRGANTFLDALRPIGGSDVLKALQAAGPGEVVYIGKGLPTFGETETAKILEAVKALRIRTIAVGSDANLPLLERLGGMMRVTPNDEVDKRVGEIAATLGSPVISGLKVEGENIRDVGGARDVFAGERMVAVGRYKGAGTGKIAISGKGYHREIDVAFPDKEEANNPIRRLWAQRKVSDLIAQGESKKDEITALGLKYQIMTPYTSFLVLENDQMWKDHQLKREQQKQDQVLGKKLEDEKKRMGESESAAHEIATKREVTRVMADLLDTTFKSYEGRAYDRVIKLCDELLTIDPQYPVAKELRENAEKARHKDMISDPMNGKIRDWRLHLDTSVQAVIPESQTVRFPSRDEWAEVSKRISTPVLKVEGVVGDQGRSDFSVRIDQAQIDITKNVRDGERFLSAHMYDEALRAFEGAEWQIQNLPKEPGAMQDLLPSVQHSILTASSARTFDQLRTPEEKPRMAGAETVTRSREIPAAGSEGEELLNKRKSIDEEKSRLRLVEENKASAEFVRAPGAPITDALRVDNPTGAIGPSFFGMSRPPAKDPLETESSGKAARVNDVQRQLEAANTETTKYEGDMQVFVRQLEVQLAQIQELTTKVDEHRSKLVKNLNEKSLAVAELQYSRQLAEKLQKDLSELEEKHLELAREKRKLEERINGISQNGSNVNVAPKKALEAKVTAIAPGLGLVVISVGKDDGVLEGDEFSIYRGGDFVAKIVIDRADRKWSAGRIVLKKSDPKVADDVDNLLRPPDPVRRPMSTQERLDLESAANLEAIRMKMGQKQ